MAAAGNRLILSLPRRDQTRLLEVCDPVRLEFGADLAQADVPARHAYIPIDCFISLVTAIDGERELEVGMVGSEGMLGAELALGVARAPFAASVQGAGSAWRVKAAAFARALAASLALQQCLRRYVYVLTVQLGASAACTRFHGVGPRLARCLLMSHDRSHCDTFHLTHEVLAALLGVRRVGITRAAGDLQCRRLIRYHRGQITVLDRAGLEAVACGCYAADRHAYARMMA
jgi:CRP-like cAMP-binding protein